MTILVESLSALFHICFPFSVKHQPHWGLVRPVVEVSRSHTHRPIHIHSHAHIQTQTHAHGRTPLDNWSARCKATTYTTHTGARDEQPFHQRPQIYALDRVAISIRFPLMAETFIHIIIIKEQASFGWGTAPKDGRFRVRFPERPLESLRPVPSVRFQ